MGKQSCLTSTRRLILFFHRRENQMGVEGWAAVADALERVTCLTSLNGCGQYAGIRAGGMREMELSETELAVWAMLFLERSAETLTEFNARCQKWGRVGRF
jgi:hypothetical protein